MSNTNHTPGKWHVDGHNLTAVIAEMPHTAGTSHPAYQHVCDCNYGYLKPEENFELNKANAKLIAAAPELLEALQGLYEGMKQMTVPEHNPTMRVALAAIQKATD